jgi:hypothetical protein
MKGVALIILLLPKVVLSQVVEGQRYSSAIRLNVKQFKGKNGDLALKNTAYFIYKVDTIPTMRVPYYLINSRAKEEILGIQNDLAKAKEDFLNKKVINVERASLHLSTLRTKDKSWFISFYQREVEFYQRYEKIIKPRELLIADSLVQAKRRIEKEKRKTDSLALIERTKGYYFVNAPQLSLLAQANVSSKALGTIEPYSYVKKVQEKELNGYAKIKVIDWRDVDEAEGFVLATFLVNSLDKVTVSSPNRETAFKGYFASFIKKSDSPSNSSSYQSSQFKSTPSSTKTTRSSEPSRTYYRGPRGGCYYYSSSGKKVYVDHSYCN